ncbi:MAG: YggT family protein [Ostreibacterium sp.]
MSTQQIIAYLLMAVQILFIGRFHLELSKVNSFVEPINSIRKVTNPLVLPMKRLTPFTWVKKFAAIQVAFLITLIVYLVIFQVGVMHAFVMSLLMLIVTWIKFLQYGMFLFIIGTWVKIPALQHINYLLYNLFEPMLRPIRQIIPSFGGLDFSPIVFLFGLSFAVNIISKLVVNLFY